MAMAAVRRLLSEKSVRLTWVAGEQVVPLLKRTFPEVEILAVSESLLLKQGRLQALREVVRIQPELAFRRWDRVVVGYRDSRYRLLAGLGLSGIRKKFDAPAGVYHADVYFELLGGDPKSLRLNPLHPFEVLKAQGGVTDEGRGKRGWVIAPGGAKNLLRDDALRRYPLEHYREVASLGLKQGRTVTVMGAASDEWVRSSFSGLQVRFELGTVSLAELPSWLGQFERLITHDSGPMHLGFLAGIPVTALFGPTRADEKVPRNHAALGGRVIQGGQGLSCAPCYDGRDYADCSHQRCLREVTPEECVDTSPGVR